MAVADDPFFDQFQPVAAPTTPVPNSGVSGTGTGGTAPGTPTPTGPVTMQAFNDAWLSSPYPGTVDGLKQFIAAHPEYAAAGITLGGSKGDKVYGPGGAYWGDAVIAAGEGGKGKSGLSGPGAASGAAGLGYGSGDWMKPFTGQYALPTLDEFKASPFYGAGLDAMMRTRQNSAAAKGTLLNGRVNEALNNSALDYGLGQYGTLAGLNQGVFGTNYQIFKDNQDRPFDKNVTLATLGAPK